MKKILILTAGFGEGHNSAARGIRDGLARVAPDRAEVELHDLFPQAYGALNELVRKTYLALINQWPRSWGYFCHWLDGITNFDERLQKFVRLKKQLESLLERFQPDVVASTFPPYPYLLRQIFGPDRRCKNVVVITDSITVNAIWYRCDADYFLVPNEQSAAVVRAGGVASEKIRTFGFPVSPKFSDLTQDRQQCDEKLTRRVLYVISGAKKHAPKLVRKLLAIDIDLTVTVGYDQKLRHSIESAVRGRRIDILGWTDEIPRMLCRSHLVIGKAGGALVQESIAARCPIIINHIVSGQEEGNAQLIVETNSGVIARSPDEVITQVQRAFVDGAKQWRAWAMNISKLSRPRASIDTAEFLLSI